MAQARVGGETGLNGEFYKGGQFLPNSEETIKGMQNSKTSEAKPRKQEIAPYLWQVSGQTSIWSKISGIVKFIGKTSYSKETGKVGRVEIVANMTAMGWTTEGIKEMETLVTRWNNGERWV